MSESRALRRSVLSMVETAGNSCCSNFTSNCNQYDFGYTYLSGCSSRWNALPQGSRRGRWSTVPTLPSDFRVC